MATQVIKVPDIGADSVDLIEILVAVGDQVELDQSLVALESDKASLEVPSPVAGRIISFSVAVGDKLSEGMDLLEIEVEVVEATEESGSVADDSNAESVPEEAVQSESADLTLLEVTESEQLFQVPDIGSDEAEIIEVSVAVGDEIDEGDTIVVLETDKASVDVPAEAAGTVVTVHVSEGGKIKQGVDLVTLKIVSNVASTETVVETVPTEVAETFSSVEEPPVISTDTPAEPESKVLLVPDMGSDSAQVIELSVAVGDRIEEGDTIVVAETDKASVDVPAEASGEITEIHVAVDASISQGDKLVTIMADAVAAPAETVSEPIKPAVDSAAASSEKSSPVKDAVVEDTQIVENSGDVHAGPSVRKLARQLGVNLSQVKPTGQRNRIIKEDVHSFVKQKLSSASGSSTAGAGIPEIPGVDWSKFGEVDVQPMSRIGKVTAANMVRNWLNVPHVTQFDSADVTELEQYRGYLKAEAAARGIKMTPLAFLLRAAAVALQENPKFNTALQGDDLVERKFFHISIAVDTPLGLMVPVIRDVDQKDIWELASEVSSLAAKAKSGKLSPKEMQGASFTISSLGAIGGTGFTPIVPAPQVGILGVSKTDMKPVWDGSNFIPRKMMPLALSYDHRVVNGADAGKFMTCLVSVLGDLNRIWNG